MFDAGVKFDWAARIARADTVRDVLSAERIAALEAHPAELRLRRSLVASKVASAGVALDQEGGQATDPAITAQFTGIAPPEALVRSIRLLVDVGHTGLVIDTLFPVVEIDDHPDIGLGVIALIEPRRVHLFSVVARRALTEAIRSAGIRAGAAA
jgi:hypothetical protein